MKAVLLAGGYGKRLEPLTLNTPKCLLPVACKPNIFYILEALKSVPHITEVIISTNEVQERQIRESIPGIGEGKIRLVVEKSTGNEDKLGAVKGLKHVFDEVGADDAVIIGSDNFVHGLDLSEVAERIRTRQSSAIIVVHHLEDERLVEKFGIAVLGPGNVVQFFQEKPKLSEAKSRLASTAIYCVSKEFVENTLQEFISFKESKGEKPDNLGELWSYALKKERVTGAVFTGIWGDIGDVQSYLRINTWMLDRLRSSQKLLEESAHVSETASLGPFAVVSSNAKVLGNAKVSNSVLFKGATVSEGASVEGSVIDYDAVIGKNAHVGEGCIVGKGAIVNDNATLPRNSKLWPYTCYGFP